MVKRKILCLVIAVLLVLPSGLDVYASTETSGNWQDNDNVATSFSGGNGSEESPYQISTAA